MKDTNDNCPFAAHGIDHLSASSINLFIEDPARWVMRYLFVAPKQQKPVFWRGTAVDDDIGRMFGMKENQKEPVAAEDCKTLAMEQYFGLATYWQEQGYEFDAEEVGKESANLTKYLDSALPFYEKLGKPSAYQKEINLMLDDCPVPINGFIDLMYGEGDDAVVRDIKTTGRKPLLRPSVARQLAIYAQAETATPIVDYVYVTSRTSEVITFDVDNWELHLDDVRRAVKAMTNLVSYSNDATQIASLIYPDYDKWSWSAEEIHFAKSIWR
mgnify:CR=1 FL=1